jgi:hypothetical protein
MENANTVWNFLHYQINYDGYVMKEHICKFLISLLSELTIKKESFYGNENTKQFFLKNYNL